MNGSIEVVGRLNQYDVEIIRRYLPLKVLNELKRIESDITIDGGQLTSSKIEEMVIYQIELEKASI